jgi:hypothetical protein
LDKAVESNGHGLFERQDDWSSCAYFHLDQPTNNLPVLADVEDRIVALLGSEEMDAPTFLRSPSDAESSG